MIQPAGAFNQKDYHNIYCASFIIHGESGDSTHDDSKSQQKHGIDWLIFITGTPRSLKPGVRRVVWFSPKPGHILGLSGHDFCTWPESTQSTIIGGYLCKLCGGSWMWWGCWSLDESEDRVNSTTLDVDKYTRPRIFSRNTVPYTQKWKRLFWDLRRREPGGIRRSTCELLSMHGVGGARVLCIAFS